MAVAMAMAEEGQGSQTRGPELWHTTRASQANLIAKPIMDTRPASGLPRRFQPGLLGVVEDS